MSTEPPEAPEDPAASPSGERLPNPWWIPPFLGRIPTDIRAEHLSVLGFVAFAMVFEYYDLGLMSAALPNIAKEYGLSDVEKGYFMSAIDFGALPSLLLVPLADRIGRRRLLLLSVIGMSLGSAATAFAPTVVTFAVFQIFMRTFAVAASIVSFVIIAEEFPASSRGWGIGMLGALGAFGFGLGALAYSQVERLPYGWRAIYFMGGFAIFLLPVFRRRIQETRRFQASAAARANDDTEAEPLLLRTLGPLWRMARGHPKRALALAILGVLSTAGHRPCFRFVSDFLQETHAWTPGNYATMMLVGGLLSVIGNVAAGHLADRFGRRRVGLFMLLPFPVFAYGFYQGPAFSVVPWWIFMAFTSMASGVILRALATELFPTDLRGSGSAWLVFVETIGAGGGLFLFALIETTVGDMSLSLSVISLLCGFSVLGFLLLPDTHQRELEEIAGEAV